MWLEKYNMGSWDSVPSSAIIYPPSPDFSTYSYTFTTPMLDDFYRLFWVDNATLDTFIIDTIYTDCGNYLGIESYNSSAISKVEYYNTMGQVVYDPVQPGLYIRVLTYVDNGRSTTKIYVNK